MGKNFCFLNALQFLVALNENLFRYIVIYFLIFFEGQENASLIMALTGGIFILPFLLFSSLGGIFADRWSKSRIILITRFFQVAFFMIAMAYIYLREIKFVYILLFIIACNSAIFGPSKYGIISEIVPKKFFLKANGYIAAFTYFGIIFGTTLASFFDTISHPNYTLMTGSCVVIALVGTILSFFISYTSPANPKKKWPVFIYKEIFESLKDMASKPLMLTVTFGYAYFLFIGAFVQMNIIPYSVTTLEMEPIVGGYLFLVTSIGVGIGSMIVPKLKFGIRSMPWSGMGMSIGCFFFTFFPHPFWLNIIWLILLGIFGGLYLVPPQAFILENSAPENKGRNFGTANFFSFLAAFLAAIVIYLLNTVLGSSPSRSFTWIGILNLAVVILLFLLTRQKKRI